MDIELIKIRAKLFEKIRCFFADKKVLEVDTPHLGSSSVSDPNVDSITCGSEYLQTSPELYMKQLLCHGSGDIYQLAHVFRNEVKSQLHKKEFMMLEWYRLGFNMHELISEVMLLIDYLLPQKNQQIISYEEAFKKHTDIHNVLNCSDKTLQAYWEKNKQQTITVNMIRDDWLNLLMVDFIEPNLIGATIIHSFPKSQASLAKIKGNISLRFELYIDGVELANGFEELQSSEEQRQRFVLENAQRVRNNQPQIKINEDFLHALKKPGLPKSSGVALGIDRLLMILLGKKDIAEVNLF